MSAPVLLHRVSCAAFAAHGCMAALVWPDSVRGITADGEVTSAKGLELLRLNGWRLDAGRWICGGEHR